MESIIDFSTQAPTIWQLFSLVPVVGPQTAAAWPSQCRRGSNTISPHALRRVYWAWPGDGICMTSITPEGTSTIRHMFSILEVVANTPVCPCYYCAWLVELSFQTKLHPLKILVLGYTTPVYTQHYRALHCFETSRHATRAEHHSFSSGGHDPNLSEGHSCPYRYR